MRESMQENICTYTLANRQLLLKVHNDNSSLNEQKSEICNTTDKHVEKKKIKSANLLVT